LIAGILRAIEKYVVDELNIRERYEVADCIIREREVADVLIDKGIRNLIRALLQVVGMIETTFRNLVVPI
jgi:hypothetical protein